METNQNACVTWPFDIIANDNGHIGPEGGKEGKSGVRILLGVLHTLTNDTFWFRPF